MEETKRDKVSCKGEGIAGICQQHSLCTICDDADKNQSAESGTLPSCKS
jgi:hypothetical protein